jgi:malate dehydrogenase (oxaloacetate-decarboxylating)(NADP+)
MPATTSAPRSSTSETLEGARLLHDPRRNKGSAFTERERAALHLRGLLPPRVDTMDEQVLRVMENYRHKTDDLEKFIHLAALHDRNETLFYRVLLDHIEEMMPIVYTPVVGKACQLFGHIFRRPRGLFLSALDKGSMGEILHNWEEDDVRVIVVTDGERILGLGDLGANGMGIPIGKLTLYSACAGVHPDHTLPVTLDAGTDNEELLQDPLYLGIRHRRHRGEAYDALVEEFVVAANERWPGVLIQFEDFANLNSFRLLEKYRNRICMFNDDIQGTAAVTLAGLLSALRVVDQTIADQRLLFLGAGSAGVGIAQLVVSTMRQAGVPESEAKRRCWFVDSRGLVVKSRTDLEAHKLEFAHEAEPVPDLLAAIRAVRPTAIIGVSGRPGSFPRETIEEMARINRRPIVFALSNPTSKTECTAEQAYAWSEGRAIYASGSPFPAVRYGGKTFVPGQANNAYVFPGVGLGVIACRAAHVTDEMLAAAALALAREVSESDLASGCLYPPLAKIRDTSLVIAAAVAEVAYEKDLATVPEPEDLRAFLKDEMYQPVYPKYA